MTLQQTILHKLLDVNDGRLDDLTIGQLYKAIHAGIEAVNFTLFLKGKTGCLTENETIEIVVNGVLEYYQ